MAVALLPALSTAPLMLLLVLHLSLTADTRQVCSVPKTVKNTKMFLFSGTYEVNNHLRYVCEDGYKREAGTSNLAICQINVETKNADWKYGNISCIRDPLIPITTPTSAKSPSTTSVSSASHISIQSSTTVETFTTVSSTPTVKIHETPHTTQEKVTQTQILRSTSVVWSSTINDHTTTPGRTRSPGLQSFTQSIFPKETVKTISEQPTATVSENTGYIATDLTDTQIRPWQKTEIAMATGTPVIIVLLVGIVIIVVYCRKTRSETLPRITDAQINLQTTNPGDHRPVPDTSPEETEEESFL